MDNFLKGELPWEQKFKMFLKTLRVDDEREVVNLYQWFKKFRGEMKLKEGI